MNLPKQDECDSTLGPVSSPHSTFERKRAARRDLYNNASIIIPLLLARKYHLPGNNYCQDWIQYIRNNHPLLGIFLHQRLHPLRWGQRIIFLLGSISFGLTVTSFVSLYFIYIRKDMNTVLLCFDGLKQDFTHVSDTCRFRVTYGMVTLWTVGGLLHSVFDISLWFLSACCCLLPGGMFHRYGRFRKIGSYIVLVLVASMVALALFSVILRAKFEARLHGINPNGSYLLNYPESFSFAIGYLIEQGLVWFVYYFILVTVLFSGILGCGCVPILGGRPYEISLEWKEKERELKRLQSLTVEIRPSVDQFIHDPDAFEVYRDSETNRDVVTKTHGSDDSVSLFRNPSPIDLEQSDTINIPVESLSRRQSRLSSC